ncbi:MAG: MFS transporter, partial [Planctomycetota bacterium]
MLDFLPALLVDLAIYLINFTLQHVLADRLGTGTDIELPLALFSAVYTTTYVAGTLGLGPFSDRPGWRRACMCAGLLVTALVPIFMFVGGLELGLWVFYASMAVLGVGSALFWPAQQARIGDRSGSEKLPGALFRFNVGWTAGKALGLGVAGVLYKGVDGPAHPTYALLAAVAAALLAL